MILEARGDKKDSTFEHTDPDFLQLSVAEINKLPQEERDKIFWQRREYNKGVPRGMMVRECVSVGDLNVWALCTTSGDYNEEHHELMLFGDEKTGYTGNPSLDGWCVFDTRKLVRALSSEVRRHVCFRKLDRWTEVLYCREVDYNWQQLPFKNAMDFLRGTEPISVDDAVKQSATKRELFSTEREFRIIALGDPPLLPPCEPALYVDSNRIYNSIINIGQYTKE